MAGESEDLEFNPFYLTLQSQTFLPIYDQAQQNCWLVCIPQATSLTGCTINRQFVDMHLLKPSALYRDHYDSTVGGKTVTWQLKGNQLQTIFNTNGPQLKPFTATVLSEELAYNRALRQYKIFILNRPLDPDYQPSTSTNRVQDSLKVKRTYAEQREFLVSFRHHKQPLSELDQKISSFFNSYMLVETESLFQDTASKLKAIAHQAASSFLAANRGDERMADRRVKEAVWLAIEAVLLCSVHSKLFPAICGLHKKQEAVFNKRCLQLRGKLTPQVLGLSDDFQGGYHKTLRELNKMDNITSPLDGLYMFQDALDTIMEDIKDNIRNQLRMGEPPPLASDDLIALLASIIVQTDCSHLLSALYYMEHFHWSLSDADKLSFSLVTLRAAVEYIRGPEVVKLLPGAEETRRLSSSGIKQIGLSHSPTHIQLSSKLQEGQTNSSILSTGGFWSHSELANTTLPSEGRWMEGHVLYEVADQRKQDKPQPRVDKKREETKSELGPFLSTLMNRDTVSSNYYFDR